MSGARLLSAVFLFALFFFLLLQLTAASSDVENSLKQLVMAARSQGVAAEQQPVIDVLPKDEAPQRKLFATPDSTWSYKECKGWTA